MTEKFKIFVCAGEASGDTHAAKLLRALREAAPEAQFDFIGAGGPKLRDAGLNAVVRTDDMSIVGLPEIARALPMFLRALRQLIRAAKEMRPDVAVLVDYPDFNLRLARSLKKKGIKVVYYISPQLWAWRKYRLRALKRDVDLLISILPFEQAWYSENGFDRVKYVGSPVVREIHVNKEKELFCRAHGLDPRRPVISLLPGSRHREMVRIMPEMLRAAAVLANTRPDAQFVVGLAHNRTREEVATALGAIPARERQTVQDRLVVVHEDTYDALNASDAAAVASGTATLETGVIGTPMAIVYKTSGLNYKLLRPLIDVSHFGLINLIAGKRVSQELIQHDFTAAALAAELLRLMEPHQNAEARRELKEAVDKLGRGGASKRAAEAILDLIRT